MSDLALICASCPEAKHDVVANICQVHKIQKAYGRTGDMVDSLAGKDWVAKWQAKVVMAAVTLASSMSVNRVKLICIQGGRFCNEEYKQTQLLKAAVEREWKDGKNGGKILVDVHWTDFEAFVADYPLVREKPKPDHAGKGKAGRSTDDTPSGIKHSGSPPPAVPAQSRHKKAEPAAAPTPTSTKGNNTSTKDATSGGRSAKAEHKAPPPRTPAPDAPTFTCDECGKDFKNKEQLAQHLASTNHFEITLKCKGCEKTFADKLRLKQHQGSTGHFGQQKLKVRQRDIAAEDDVWTCGQCQKEFKSELALENHQQSTGHFDPECPVCEKTFYSVESLLQHMAATEHDAIIWQLRNGEISRTEAVEKLSAAKAEVLRPARKGGSDQAKHACPVCHAGFKCLPDKSMHMMFSAHIFLFGDSDTGYYFKVPHIPGHKVPKCPRQDDATDLRAFTVDELLYACEVINFDVSGCCAADEIIDWLEAARSGAPPLTLQEQRKSHAAHCFQPHDGKYYLTPLAQLSKLCKENSIDTSWMRGRQEFVNALKAHDRVIAALPAGTDVVPSFDVGVSVDEASQEASQQAAESQAYASAEEEQEEDTEEPVCEAAAALADVEFGAGESQDGEFVSVATEAPVDVEFGADEAQDGESVSVAAEAPVDVVTSAVEAPRADQDVVRVNATPIGEVKAFSGAVAIPAVGVVKTVKSPNVVVFSAPAQTVVDGLCTCMFSRMSPHRMSKCTIGGGKAKK